MDRNDSFNGKNTSLDQGRFDKNKGRRACLFCNYCKKAGHVIEKCYKLHGFPPNSRFRGGKRTAALVQTGSLEFGPNSQDSVSHATAIVPGLTAEQSSQLVALLQNVQLSQSHFNASSSTQDLNSVPGSAAFSSFAGIVKSDYTKNLCLFSCVSNWQSTWIIDTGASDHMCYNKDLFSSLQSLLKPSTVTLPDGKCVSVTHVGTVVLSEALTLQGVLYVPSFKYNLLSISKLTSQTNGYVIFTPKHCFMQDLSLKKPLALGSFCAGLYLLKPHALRESTVNGFSSLVVNQQEFSCNASSVPGNIWHVRLGHLPFTKLQQLGLITEHSDITLIKQCLVCSKARHHRLPFPHSKIYSTHSFDLIHVALWGPYKVQTYNGFRYFLTIVDDCS